MTRLAESVCDTCSGHYDIEIVCLIGRDDPCYDEYILNECVRYLTIDNGTVSKTNPLSDMWNMCWKAADGDIFMMCGDDTIFRTQDWDVLVRETAKLYTDDLYYIYGSDGVNEDFGTMGFVSKRWTDILGYFVPAGFPCGYVDSWLNTLAKGVERHIKIDALFEHMHPSHGKASYDHVYSNIHSMESYARNLWDSTQQQRQLDIKLLNAHIIDV